MKFAAIEANPNMGGGADDCDSGRGEFLGVTEDDGKDFAGIANSVERDFGAVSEAKMGEMELHRGLQGHAGDSAAVEHLFDGVEEGVVDAIAEGNMETGGVWR